MVLPTNRSRSSGVLTEDLWQEGTEWQSDQGWSAEIESNRWNSDDTLDARIQRSGSVDATPPPATSPPFQSHESSRRTSGTCSAPAPEPWQSPKPHSFWPRPRGYATNGPHNHRGGRSGWKNGRGFPRHSVGMA